MNRLDGGTLMVAPDFGVGAGGIGRLALCLARGLREAQLAPTVLTRQTEVLAPFPFPVVHYPARRLRLLDLLAALRHIRRQAQRLRPARLLLAHWFPAGLAARRLARGGGPPYYVVVHGFEVLAPWRQGGWRKRLMLPVLREAAGLLILSEYNRRLIEELGLPGPVHRLRPGVRLEDFAPRPALAARAAQLRERWNLGARRVLLSVGRLVPRKGLDLVVDALPALLRQAPDLAYVAAGAGPEAARLRERAAAAGVAEALVLPGFVPEEDLAALYQAAEIFVMPARELPEEGQVEGFGLVFLEAAAAGLPVVAARSGGVSDAVRDGVTGLLVPPGDREALAAALSRLIEDRDLARRLGVAGLHRVGMDFSPAACRDSLRRAFAAPRLPPAALASASL